MDPSPDIAAAVAAARAGDRAAWARLYAHYAPVVHAVALANGPADRADDVVQEAFVRGLAKLGTLRDDHAFGGWLCRIARNVATDGHRRRRGWTVLRDIFFVRPRPTVEAAEALDAIRALPEAYRELLMMRFVEQLTGPEIAERLGRSQGSVRVSLHRGTQLLRQRLEGSA